VAVTSVSGQAAAQVLSPHERLRQTVVFDFARPTPMNTSFDQTHPHHSRWDQEGAEYVRSNMDWVARCSKRLVGLNPGLVAEQALDLARDLSLDDSLRARSPELVAEDLHRVEVNLDD
jgi:hypothetical protein